MGQPFRLQQGTTNFVGAFILAIVLPGEREAPRFQHEKSGLAEAADFTTAARSANAACL